MKHFPLRTLLDIPMNLESFMGLWLLFCWRSILEIGDEIILFTQRNLAPLKNWQDRQSVESKQLN